MKDKINKIIERIKKVYLTYNRPFVIGYSGGKDSTAVLQMVWQTIIELPKEQRTNKIYVITTDTLVEMPYIISYITQSINNIQTEADKNSLPIETDTLKPLLENTFWVNLIGKGYPAPSQMFRWCTERLKIEPVNRFINENVNKYGEVTLVLGARRAESSSRSQVLSKQKRDTFGLSKHTILPSAFIFTPIEELSTDEVWQYLLSNNNPWGMNNRDLLAIYQNADGGECPMVVDKSTPSCGNSRFGCWVCTLVQKDTTMDNLIDHGEEWMIPLQEFQLLLKDTQVIENKSKYRNYKRRSGRADLVRDKSKLSYGPYLFEWKKIFLQKILEAEKQIKNETGNKNYSIISKEEMELIRSYWRKEENDWVDSLPKIFFEVYGYNLDWIKDDSVILNNYDMNLLDYICKKENFPTQLLAKLIDMERAFQGMSRRSGISYKIDKIFSEEWRSEGEIIQEIETKKQRENNFQN